MSSFEPPPGGDGRDGSGSKKGFWSRTREKVANRFRSGRPQVPVQQIEDPSQLPDADRRAMFVGQGFGSTQYPRYGEDAAPPPVPKHSPVDAWALADIRLATRTRVQDLELEEENRRAFEAREQEAMWRRDLEAEQREKVGKSWRAEAQELTFNEPFEQYGSEGPASPTGLQMAHMREELYREYGIVNPSPGMLEHSVRRPGGIPVNSAGSDYSGFADSPDHSDDANPSASPPPIKSKKYRESLITDLRRQGIDDPKEWLRKQRQTSQSTYGRSQDYDVYSQPSTSAGPSGGRSYAKDSRVREKEKVQRGKRERDNQGRSKGRGSFDEEYEQEM